MNKKQAKDKLWTKCEPSAEFENCFEVSVFIKASPEELWPYLSDPEILVEAFLGLKFKRDKKGSYQVGETYCTKLRIERKWTEYKIIAVEENRRLSSEQIGKHWLIKKARYDHRFIPVEGGAISREKVEYSLQFGILGKILNALFVGWIFRKIDLRAHKKLKEKVEGEK